MQPNYTFVTGAGGTGKTHWAKQHLLDDPMWAQFSSTTGISSVNLDCVTLNSLLGYFDTQSLRDAYIDGRLHRMMAKVFKSGYSNLLIDECSMLDGNQLDIIVDCLEHLAENIFPDRQLGLVLLGDYAQLSVVKGKYCFESQSWPKFEGPNTIKLTKNWRAVDDPTFTEFLTRYRSGEGDAAVDLLRKHCVDSGNPLRMEDIFLGQIDTKFVGTSIMGTNAEVSRYNQVVLQGIKGKPFTLTSEREGKLLPQWGMNKLTKEWGIPPSMELKEGAYVMLLANAYDLEREIIFSNGDCGHVQSYENGVVKVKLARNGRVVDVGTLTRYALAYDKPNTDKFPLPDNYVPQLDQWLKRWRVGEITYYPMRLAFASTVHKVQALTLDRIQIDLRQGFMGANHMSYVALSRCRSINGLRIVGTPDLLAKRCRVDPRVLRFL